MILIIFHLQNLSNGPVSAFSKAPQRAQPAPQHEARRLPLQCPTRALPRPYLTALTPFSSHLTTRNMPRSRPR